MTMIPLGRKYPSRPLLVALMAVVFFTAFSVPAFAAEGGSLAGIIYSWRTSLVSILRTLLIIGGMGALVMAVICIMKGENDGAKRFFIWLVGMAIGFLLLSVLGSRKVTVSAGATADFSGTKNLIKDALMALLTVVSLITMVGKVFQVIQGEKEGSRQLFKWFLVSLIGIIILNAV